MEIVPASFTWGSLSTPFDGFKKGSIAIPVECMDHLFAVILGVLDINMVMEKELLRTEKFPKDVCAQTDKEYSFLPM